MKIIIALIIFSAIILFHELGHFLLAKKNGIRVNEFCLGLGPTIVGITRGETKYSIKLLPFGGACMMEGEDEESNKEDSFDKKSVWARMAVVVAGPVFNFILAFVFAIIVMAAVGYDAPRITDTVEGLPAAEAGLKQGDVILKMNEKNIHFSREVNSYTYFHAGEEIDLTYERDGKVNTIHLVPQYNEEENKYLFGFTYNILRERGNVFETIKYSFYEMKFCIVSTLESLKYLITGAVGLNELSGPVGIVKTIGDTYDASLRVSVLTALLNLANLVLLLSANLGVMNLLPIPALDGGRLLFLIIEAIRGKRVDPNREGMVHFVGLVFLFALMGFVMFNDIRKLL